MTTKAGHIKLERAHRVLTPKPDPNKRPRTLLIHFHSFRDKQRVMQAVHRLSSEDGGLKLNGSMVSVYNDFSTAVLKKAYDARSEAAFTGAGSTVHHVLFGNSPGDTPRLEEEILHTWTGAGFPGFPS